MTKRLSEGFLGAALRQVELATYVYKPMDGAGNWRPCDFMVWVDAGDGGPASVWFEAKDEKALETFNWRSQMRPAQVQGIRDAERLGIPYYLAIYWRRHREWTISDAIKVYHATRLNGDGTGGILSFKRKTLSSSFGIESSPGQLASVAKAVLLGEIL